MKTLRDHMKEHHPEYIGGTATLGGMLVCPTTVSDFNHLNLKPLCEEYPFPINYDTCCTDCWNRPYTPPNNIEETHSPEPAKTYEGGLNEAWKLQQKLSALTYQQLENAGMSIFWRNYSYNEAKSKYDSYTEELIKIGDEITDGKSTGYVLYIDNESNLMCVKLDSYSYPQEIDTNNPRYHKTGKHNLKLAEAISEITEDPQ